MALRKKIKRKFAVKKIRKAAGIAKKIAKATAIGVAGKRIGKAVTRKRKVAKKAVRSLRGKSGVAISRSELKKVTRKRR